MSTKHGLGAVLMGTLICWGCGSDGGGGDSEGSGGMRAGAGGGGGGDSATTGGSTGDAGATGGNTGGTTGVAECSDLGDALPANVTELFRASTTGSLLNNFQLLGFEDNAVFVGDGTEVKRVPVDGGAIEIVDTFADGDMPSLLRGDYYLFRTSSATDTMNVDLSAAPVTDPTRPVPVTTLESGYYLYYDADAVYYETRDPQSIWAAPYDGSGVVELVPGGSPLGMVVHQGYLYWTDFVTSWLTRVPTTGGTPEPLGEAFFGGPMVGDGNTIYYSDTSLHSLIRYTLGQSSVESIFDGDLFDSPEELSAQNGTVYFFVGTFCKQLYQASAPDAAQLLVNGFGSGYWLQATPSGVVVADDSAVYRVALP